MMELDTGICAPESKATLRLQQEQLIRGKRNVQMFPVGTAELDLPVGFSRHENFRGVFHYDPLYIDPESIDFAGLTGSENLILNLGRFNKTDIAQRIARGENVTSISEYTPDGVEVRTAAATSGTVEEQKFYFERTKEPENIIVIGVLPDRVVNHMTGT